MLSLDPDLHRAWPNCNPSKTTPRHKKRSADEQRAGSSARRMTYALAFWKTREDENWNGEAGALISSIALVVAAPTAPFEVWFDRGSESVVIAVTIPPARHHNTTPTHVNTYYSSTGHCTICIAGANNKARSDGHIVHLFISLTNAKFGR